MMSHWNARGKKPRKNKSNKHKLPRKQKKNRGKHRPIVMRLQEELRFKEKRCKRDFKNNRSAKDRLRRK